MNTELSNDRRYRSYRYVFFLIVVYYLLGIDIRVYCYYQDVRTNVHTALHVPDTKIPTRIYQVSGTL